MKRIRFEIHLDCQTFLKETMHGNQIQHLDLIEQNI